MADPETDSAEVQPQAPQFSPLFTLLTNETTNTTHHPQVHYLFADDDPDILTHALAASADTNPSERALVLDLAPTEQGWEVAWCSSLTPDWAVVSATVSRMEEDSGGGAGENNLILRVEGVENQPPVQEEAGEASGREDYAALIGEFDKRMKTLRRVVEVGKERRRKIGETIQEAQTVAQIGEEPEEKGKEVGD